MEIWKKIYCYDNYEVSNSGVVRNSNTGNIIIGGKSNGYRQIGLNKDCKTKRVKVHRLVAFAFIHNPENKPYVNHINGIKTDNRVENLEWCTAKENTIHAIKNGLQVGKKGIESHLFKKNGSESIRAKKVVDTSNGVVYGCVMDASIAIGKSYEYTVKQLNGNKKNNTTLIYL